MGFLSPICSGMGHVGAKGSPGLLAGSHGGARRAGGDRGDQGKQGETGKGLVHG